MMKKFWLLIFLLIPTGNTFAQDIQKNLWSPREKIFCTELSPTHDTLYIAGSFTYIGPYTGSGAVLSYNTDTADLSWPKPNGVIRTVISDGDGGWYIGGNFTYIDSIPFKNIAHLKADKTVNLRFKPNINNTVYALALRNDTLYAGGDFTSINDSIIRSGLASFKTQTGEVTDWDPFLKQNAGVSALQIYNGNLYVAGYFHRPNYYVVSGLTAFSLSNGTRTQWNPEIEGPVTTFAIADSVLYAGGNFKAFHGESPRNYLAAFNITDGAVRAWDPQVSATVHKLAMHKGRLYAAGDFWYVNKDVTRNRVASFNLSDGKTLSWNAKLADPDNVYFIMANDSGVYLSGSFFKNMNNNIRDNFKAFTHSGEKLTSWLPKIDGYIHAYAQHGSKIFLGGDITSVGGVLRNYVAAIDLRTGRPTEWNPEVLSYVFGLTLHDSVVYLAGDFKSVNKSYIRANLAAVKKSDGSVLPWNPNPNGYCSILGHTDSTLYIRGEFNNIAGQKRDGIAAFSMKDGSLTDWHLDITGSYGGSGVYTSTIHDSILYIGGRFTAVNGVVRNNLAALKLSDASLTGWNPDANDAVYTLAAADSIVYAGGDFTEVNNSVGHNYVAAFNTKDGKVLPWNINLSRPYETMIYALGISGSILYVGGQFEQSNYSVKPIGAFSRQTGDTLSWSHRLASAVTTINFSKSQKRMYLGCEDGNPWSFYGGRSLFGITNPADITLPVQEDWTFKEPTDFAFPNPAFDHITVNASVFRGKIFTMRITNILGKVMAEHYFHNETGSVRVPVESFQTGLYIIALSSKDKTITQTFLKE
jgi:hypothetical protein